MDYTSISAFISTFGLSFQPTPGRHIWTGKHRVICVAPRGYYWVLQVDDIVYRNAWVGGLTKDGNEIGEVELYRDITSRLTS